MNEVVQVLKTTAEQLRKLDIQILSTLENQDTTGFVQKLEERARLIIKLPERLADPLKNVGEKGQEVQNNVNSFASTAQTALDSGGTLGLLAFLTHKGMRIGGKNDLEKLIDSLVN